MSLSVIACLRAMSINAIVSMVTRPNILVIRLLIMYCKKKRDRHNVSLFALEYNIDNPITRIMGLITMEPIASMNIALRQAVTERDTLCPSSP